MADKMLTDAEYVDACGVECPKCKGESQSDGGRRFEGGEAFLDMSCLECEFRWTEHYVMKGWLPR